MFLSNMPEPVIATAIPWDLVQAVILADSFRGIYYSIPLPFFPLFSE